MQKLKVGDTVQVISGAERSEKSPKLLIRDASEVCRFYGHSPGL